MDWGFILGLSGITAAVIAVIVWTGLKLNRAVMRKAPELAIPLYVTRSGTILFALMVGFWVSCIAVAQLQPETRLGSFLRSLDGVGLVLTGSIAGCVVISEVLERLGYPIARRDDEE